MSGILDFSKGLHCAFYACLTTVFWGTARLGEFVLPTLSAFDPAVHVKPSNMSQRSDRQGNNVTNFFVPRTKTSPSGEDIFWGRQAGLADPHVALAVHLDRNRPPADGALFAYRALPGSATMTPLTRGAFVALFTSLCRMLNLAGVSGHSLRIGGTLELLLRNLPFEVVKAKGRWKSDAFERYLRLHGAVMAAYVQADAPLHAQLLEHASRPEPRRRIQL